MAPRSPYGTLTMKTNPRAATPVPSQATYSGYDTVKWRRQGLESSRAPIEVKVKAVAPTHLPCLGSAYHTKIPHPHHVTTFETLATR